MRLLVETPKQAKPVCTDHRCRRYIKRPSGDWMTALQRRTSMATAANYMVARVCFGALQKRPTAKIRRRAQPGFWRLMIALSLPLSTLHCTAATCSTVQRQSAAPDGKLIMKRPAGCSSLKPMALDTVDRRPAGPRPGLISRRQCIVQPSCYG